MISTVTPYLSVENLTNYCIKIIDYISEFEICLGHCGCLGLSQLIHPLRSVAISASLSTRVFCVYCLFWISFFERKDGKSALSLHNVDRDNSNNTLLV